MLTIEHCEHLHLQLAPEAQRALAAAVAQATLRDIATPAQTSAQPPALGELWPGQGGLYACTMPARNGQPGYHLILAETQNTMVSWGPYDHDVADAKDHHDGAANTSALMKDAKAHPAASWAYQYCTSEHEDFYLPSHNELMLMWICVPQLFDKKGLYWSSTQYSPYYAWVQDFEYGYSYVDYKNYERRAVAVRRLAL